MEQEFVRIGYYVNNEYSEPYDPDSPPNPVDINLLYRNILADQPRVTRFAIDWTGNAAAMPTEIIQEDAENIDAGNVNMMEDDNGLNTYGVDDEVVTSDDDDDDDDDVEIDLDGDASAEGEGDMEAMEEGDSGEDCGDVDEVTGGQSMQGMGAGMEVILNEDSMDVQRMRVIHSEVSNSYM
jgi:histone chaperone ASF1